MSRGGWGSGYTRLRAGVGRSSWASRSLASSGERSLFKAPPLLDREPGNRAAHLLCPDPDGLTGAASFRGGGSKVIWQSETERRH